MLGGEGTGQTWPAQAHMKALPASAAPSAADADVRMRSTRELEKPGGRACSLCPCRILPELLRAILAQPPVLVLWGRQDRILPPETAQKFADALPEATVTYLETSGHSGHLEQPCVAADAILEFVNKCRTTK